MTKTKLYILVLFLFGSKMAFAQQSDKDWFREKWPNSGTFPLLYVDIASRYMGPNALPVPILHDGTCDSTTWVSTRIDFYTQKGESSQNIQFQLDIPIVPQKLAAKVWINAKEYFKMDSNVRDNYKAVTPALSGSCTGDLYFSLRYNFFGTLRSDAALGSSLTFRYPSGGNYEARRYADMPGYYGGIEGFKRIFGTSDQHVDLVANGGFFIYQTNKTTRTLGQNEAYYWGAGGRFINYNRETEISISGYNGNQNNGDNPIVARLHYQISHKLNRYKIGLQMGLKDYNYNSLSFAWFFGLKKGKK